MEIQVQRMGMFLECFEAEGIEALCAVLPLRQTRLQDGRAIVGFPVWSLDGEGFREKLAAAGHTIRVEKEDTYATNHR